MTIEVFDCEQGSPEWFRCRMGIPTASEFKTIVAVRKDAREKTTRMTYMRKLAAEIIRAEPMEAGYTNAHMERGNEQEDEARDMYAFITGSDPHRVGFVRNGNKGCSPDSLIGKKGGLEIKSALSHIQLERLQNNVLPAEFRHQIQGGLWVTEREWWDFVSYCPKMRLFHLRVQRDETEIKIIAEAVDRFASELAEMVEAERSADGPSDLRTKLQQSVELCASSVLSPRAI
jgi:hypothetical protein